MGEVEVLYITDKNMVVRFKIFISLETTVQDALTLSGIEKQYPETKNFSVGIFSKLVPRTTIVNPGDRVEIYRPLKLDPKEKRRKNATHRS